MESLLLGLLAALAWGVHDLCVRHISQRTDILTAILTVLVSGAALVLPIAVIWADWSTISPAAIGLSAGSGLAFLVGTIGLYRSFSIGPVRLVAPIVGGYPILSVGWAALSGQAVPLGNWLAVLAVLGGISIVASLTSEGEASGRRHVAMLWAALGGTGFAAAFALGQAGTLAAEELPVILLARVAAIGAAGLLLLLARARRPERKALPVLLAMGALDAAALGAVLMAGRLPNPEFAAVAASVFGVVTIVLAWAILRERMTAGQWLGVVIVFAGVGWLGL